MLSALAGNGSKFGRVWLDIEGAGKYWTADQVTQSHKLMGCPPFSFRIFITS